MICSLNNNLNNNSLVFNASTLVIIIGASTAIIITEIKKNEKFNAWMKSNVMLVGSFTILAGVDMNILDFLSSNFADIKVLNAPFSKPAQRWIKRIGILSIFYKDFPKLFVHVSYFLKLFFF